MSARNASWLTILLITCACAPTLGQAPDEELSRWIRQLRDPAPSYRLQATTQLGKLGKTAAPSLPGLFDRLQDIEPNVRLAAIDALVEIAERPTETATELLPLLDDSDEHVRYAAEWAMARIALATRLDEPSEELRQVFEDALRRITRRDHHERHRQVIEAAVTKLASASTAEHQKVRSLATELERMQRELIDREARLESELRRAEQVARDLQLEQRNQEELAKLHEIEQAFVLSDPLGRLRLIHQLSARKSTWPPEAVQKTRENILKQIVQRAEVASERYALNVWPDGQLVLMRLFDALSPESKLPIWAASVLGRTQPRTQADAEKLAEILALDENEFSVRFAAADALGRSPYATPFCSDRLEDVLLDPYEDLDLRISVIGPLVHMTQVASDSLRDLQVHRLAQNLMQLLGDSAEDWSLRNVAAEGLSRIAPGREAAEAYVEVVHLQELSDYELRSVVAILADFGSAGAQAGREFIARALRSSDDLTRNAATEAIVKLGGSSKTSVPALLSLLHNPDETSMVRISAVEALASIGPDAISQLASQLAEEVSEVTQAEALKALSRLGADAAPALETCVELIRNEAAALPVRCAAISVAGSVGAKSPAVVDALIEFMQADVPAAARATAIVALAKIEGTAVAAVAPTDLDRQQPATRVAVNYAQVMNGRSEGVDELVAMLHGDATEYAANALEAIGPPARQPLVRVLQNPQAASDQRVNAFKVLTRIPDKDYRPLMAAIADDVIGDQCQRWVYDMLIEGGTELLSEVVANLESRQGTGSEHRFEELAEAMLSGLGSAGEDDRIHLNCKLADELLDDVSGEVTPASSQTYSGMASATKSYGSAGSLNYFTRSLTNAELSPAAQPTQTAQPYYARAFETDGQSDSATVGQEALEADVQQTESVVADQPAASTAVDTVTADLMVPADTGSTKVKVFYGTNRAPGEGRETSVGARHTSPLPVLIAIAALTVCLFGFLRARARLYSLFAIAGLGCVAIIGLGRQLEERIERRNYGQSVPYGSQYSDQLAMGSCEVSIPESHVAGELESPSLLRVELNRDTLKHVVLEQTTELNSVEFFDDLNQQLADRGPRMLVFIHGYNVSFEDAARRTAQMSHDLEFAGAPVFYSWPSQANWWEYQLDKKNIELSVNQIKDFLLQLAAKSNATTINLVAHSMGNVGLTEALTELKSENDQALFNQVVLAAPDIDADIFRTRIAPSIVGTAKRLTLYTSSNDLALVASRYFNAGRRVGDSSGPLTVYPGVEVIDASAVDTSFLGHTYYGGSIGVLQDLAELLMDLPSDQRSNLRTASSNGQPYWIIENPLLRARQPASNGRPAIR